MPKVKEDDYEEIILASLDELNHHKRGKNMAGAIPSARKAPKYHKFEDETMNV